MHWSVLSMCRSCALHPAREEREHSAKPSPVWEDTGVHPCTLVISHFIPLEKGWQNPSVANA